jgi:putative transposase
MAARGVLLTYEVVCSWCRKFGQAYANQLRRRRPRPSNKWHLDKVFLTSYGEPNYLWWAVDQDDHVLEILSNVGGTRRLPRSFFASCSRDWPTCHG